MQSSEDTRISYVFMQFHFLMMLRAIASLTASEARKQLKRKKETDIDISYICLIYLFPNPFFRMFQTFE